MIFLAFIMFSSAPDPMGLVRKLSDLYLFGENVFFCSFSWIFLISSLFMPHMSTKFTPDHGQAPRIVYIQ